MTYEEFEKKYKRSIAFDWYFTYLSCWLPLLGTAFMFFALLTNKFIVFADSKVLAGTVLLFLFFLSLYGLLILKKKFELTVWNNDFTKQENVKALKFVLASLGFSDKVLGDDYIHFTYKDNSWSFFIADIHLFAGEHRIVINVRDFRGGFGDFGKCKSTEEMIELLFLQASC